MLNQFGTVISQGIWSSIFIERQVAGSGGAFHFWTLQRLIHSQRPNTDGTSLETVKHFGLVVIDPPTIQTSGFLTPNSNERYKITDDFSASARFSRFSR
jgi:hypothetical protein